MSNGSEILIAEDSPTQALQLRILLEQAGYRVRIATDGLDAVNQVRERQPDLVVTDLEMPELNGLEVVEILKCEYPRLPVVLTTSRGSELIASQALRKGAESYVPKQNAATELIPTLERIFAVMEADRTSDRLNEYFEFSETRYVVENDLTLVPVLIAKFQDELRRLGMCDEGDAMQIATALDEALTNAIVHGNLEVSSDLRGIDDGRPYEAAIAERQQLAPYSDRRVIVSTRTTRDEVKFVIQDCGPGFSRENLPDPTDPENLIMVSGRGLLLINAFMDEVKHNALGNEITLVKRKPNTNGHLPHEEDDA